MDGSTHYEKDERPWGFYERFTLNEQSTVKIITVNPGEAFSLQTHSEREEFWHIISGSGKVTVGSETKEASAGDNFFIHKGAEHRLEAGASGCTFLEVAYGNFDESDITRLQDKYGRS
jgi:mannose-1-phosphate guanylyltransferase/mannose-1-phosphate guanylyltransferase/mannose-6-phosphate isomerase